MFQGAKENPSPRQMVVRTIIGLVVMFVIFYLTGLLAVGRISIG